MVYSDDLGVCDAFGLKLLKAKFGKFTKDALPYPSAFVIFSR